MIQVIRVDLDKLREQAHHESLLETGTVTVDKLPVSPAGEGSQVGNKHPRADDQAGRLGAGLTSMYNMNL